MKKKDISVLPSLSYVKPHMQSISFETGGIIADSTPQVEALPNNDEDLGPLWGAPEMRPPIMQSPTNELPGIK